MEKPVATTIRGGGEHCQRCGCFYGTVYRVPDEAWSLVTGRTDGSGQLCLTCYDELARELGIELYWEASLSDWRVQCPVCKKWWDIDPPVKCCGSVILGPILERRNKMRRLLWWVKQLLPLLYISTFTEGGQRKLCIWRMWFARSFHIRYYNLAKEEA